MIAFSIGSLDIYRYGIFYFVAFLVGYVFLYRLGKKKIFGHQFPNLHRFFEQHLDDLMIAIFLGVLVGGRLGHVLIYELDYYLQHPGEIVQIRKGGMSFIGGIFGVTIALLVLARIHRLKRKELLLIGDSIFAILPFGIMLGRIGNFLNQELYGITAGEVIEKFGYPLYSLLHQLRVMHVYPQVDEYLRVNTNALASFFEGFVLLIILFAVFLHQTKRRYFQPGKIIALFLIGYSVIRFFLEYLRADSQLEFQGWFTISQRFFIGFFLIGMGMLGWSNGKEKKK